jgi:hypothetical protein
MKRTEKHYAVLKAPGEKAVIVCFSLDSTRPDDYMAMLEKELRTKKHLGEVLLDLLASNGESSRRFMKMKFDGEQLHWHQAKTAAPTSIDKKIFSFCQHFYATNPSALSKSVLSPAAQHRIKALALVEA